MSASTPALAVAVITLGGVAASGHPQWVADVPEGVRAALLAAAPALGLLVALLAALPDLRDRAPATHPGTAPPRLPRRRVPAHAGGATRNCRTRTVIRGRAQLERRLRGQLRGCAPELQLHYQPVVHASDGRVHGVEALVRWRPPVGAEIPPDEFVQVAESSDLVIDLDRWVIATALRQLADWHLLPGTEELELAVNVSGRHLLDQGFVRCVESAVDAAEIDPRCLTIEITETALIWDLDVARDHLRKVRGLGVRVALDDFGTGFTNLSLLQRLPVDTLKIDRSFTARAATDGGRHLIRALGDLGNGLGLRTVAEGIETEPQLEAVRSIGIDLLQGFLFAEAQPAQSCSIWIRDRRGQPSAWPRAGEALPWAAAHDPTPSTRHVTGLVESGPARRP